jgi:DNA excision repair protein ERCC-4
MTDLTLPALRSLGDLANTRPPIIVDTREGEPLVFSRLESRRGTLITGDYSIAGLEHLFSVERKSVSDLVGCCVGQNRERFARELHRLRGFRFKRLLVIGREDDIYLGRYHSSINPKAVFATLNAFEVRYDVPVVFASTASLAAQRVEEWVYWFAREYVLAANNILRAATNAGNEEVQSVSQD